MSLTLFVSAFYANQTYFENVYCVNKAKPQLECHGQCHLKKVIQQETQTDEQSVVQIPFSLVYCASVFEWSFLAGEALELSYARFVMQSLTNYEPTFWTPPRLV